MPDLPPLLLVLPWRDEVLERFGHDARSEYVERFWLPILGPSATLLLRWSRVASSAYRDRGVEVGPSYPAAGIASELGLGAGPGPHAPLARTIGRLERFGLASLLPVGHGPWELRVRTHLAPLTRRQVDRLPEYLRAAASAA